MPEQDNNSSKPGTDAGRPKTPPQPPQVGQRDAGTPGSAASGQQEFAVSSNPTMNNDNPNVQRATREDDDNKRKDSAPAKGHDQRDDSGNQQGTRSSTASNGAGTP